MLTAIIQMSGAKTDTRDARILRADNYLQTLSQSDERPAQIIFPEIWTTGVSELDSFKRFAETERGDTYDMMSTWAKKLGSYIHTGSFVEKDGDNYYNTSLLIAPNGNICGKYRKIHPFGFGKEEAAILTPGNQITVSKTEYGNVGFATCYDLRFPELFRSMSDMGAEYFFICAGWPEKRLDHWTLLNRTRALENQCFVVACNSVHESSLVTLGGHSMVVDPWGEVLVEGGTDECVLTCEIDTRKVHEIRETFPVLKDRHLK